MDGLSVCSCRAWLYSYGVIFITVILFKETGQHLNRIVVCLKIISPELEPCHRKTLTYGLAAVSMQLTVLARYTQLMSLVIIGAAMIFYIL